MNTIETLLAQGWREYPDQFLKHARCFYKRFDTPTRCSCNRNKAGIVVSFEVYEHVNVESIEAETCGELPDGTWVKIQQYALPKDINACLAIIPRMLATWEAIANL